MDPLAALGGLSAILQIGESMVKTVYTIRNCATTMRNAPKQVHEFTLQAANFSGNLHMFYECSKECIDRMDPASSRQRERSAHAGNLILQCGSVATGMLDLLEKIKEVQKSEDGPLLQNLWKRLLWVWNQDAVKHLKLNLNLASVTLGNFIGMLQWEDLKQRIERCSDRTEQAKLIRQRSLIAHNLECQIPIAEECRKELRGFIREHPEAVPNLQESRRINRNTKKFETSMKRTFCSNNLREDARDQQQLPLKVAVPPVQQKPRLNVVSPGPKQNSRAGQSSAIAAERRISLPSRRLVSRSQAESSTRTVREAAVAPKRKHVSSEESTSALTDSTLSSPGVCSRWEVGPIRQIPAMETPFPIENTALTVESDCSLTSDEDSEEEGEIIISYAGLEEELNNFEARSVMPSPRETIRDLRVLDNGTTLEVIEGEWPEEVMNGLSNQNNEETILSNSVSEGSQSQSRTSKGKRPVYRSQDEEQYTEENAEMSDPVEAHNKTARPSPGAMTTEVSEAPVSVRSETREASVSKRREVGEISVPKRREVKETSAHEAQRQRRKHSINELERQRRNRDGYVRGDPKRDDMVNRKTKRKK